MNHGCKVEREEVVEGATGEGAVVKEMVEVRYVDKKGRAD